MRLTLLFLILVSQNVVACIECKDTTDQLISYKEPAWEKDEIPESKDGGVLAVFDLSKEGHPINVKILLMTPRNLDEKKVIRSIESADFSLDTVNCEGDTLEKGKGILRHFKFNYGS